MKRRGRPPSRHPGRDWMCYMFVDWVIRTTGLGVGRGVAEPGDPDACIVAAYFMSSGTYGAEYVRELPDFKQVIELAVKHAPEFEREVLQFENPKELFRQLHEIDHLAVREGYQRA